MFLVAVVVIGDRSSDTINPDRAHLLFLHPTSDPLLLVSTKLFFRNNNRFLSLSSPPPPPLPSPSYSLTGYIIRRRLMKPANFHVEWLSTQLTLRPPRNGRERSREIADALRIPRRKGALTYLVAIKGYPDRHALDPIVSFTIQGGSGEIKLQPPGARCKFYCVRRKKKTIILSQ